MIDPRFDRRRTGVQGRWIVQSIVIAASSGREGEMPTVRAFFRGGPSLVTGATFATAARHGQAREPLTVPGDWCRHSETAIARH